MLGESIDDPLGVESGGDSRSIPGFGQLPVRTVLRNEKTVRRATGTTSMWHAPAFSGYEIHMGETVYSNGARAFAQIRREGSQQQTADGAVACSGRVWGTYVHGLFDDDAFRHSFLRFARESRGLAPAQRHSYFTAERQKRIDRWAGVLRESLNMDLVRHLIRGA